MRGLSPVEHYWKKVLIPSEPNKCYGWKGSHSNYGYGTIWSNKHSGNKGNIYAHRISWEIHNGPIPDGLYVCHNCPGGDLPSCTNPHHLFLGTSEDNQRDASKKGRMRTTPQRGEKSHLAKLTDADVIKILSLMGTATQKIIAQKFGVSQSTISLIFLNRAWTHIQRNSEPKPRHAAQWKKLPGAKLTEQQVREIYTSREFKWDLAEKYRVGQDTIDKIRLEKTWRKVSLTI